MNKTSMGDAARLSMMVLGGGFYLGLIASTVLGAVALGALSDLSAAQAALVGVLAAGGGAVVVPLLFGWHLFAQVRAQYGVEMEARLREWIRDPRTQPSQEMVSVVLEVEFWRGRRTRGGASTRWWVHPISLAIGAVVAGVAALMPSLGFAERAGRLGIGFLVVCLFLCATFGAELARYGYTIRSADPRRRWQAWVMTVCAAVVVAVTMAAFREAF